MDDHSKKIIAGLFLPIQERATAAIEEAAKINAFPFSGYRDFGKQKKIYAQGRTTPGIIVSDSKPGYSFHNYRLAVDMVFGGPGEWSWDAKHPWMELIEIMKKHGFEAGYYWGDTDHFQISFGIDIDTLLTVYARTWKLADVLAWLDNFITTGEMK